MSSNRRPLLLWPLRVPALGILIAFTTGVLLTTAAQEDRPTPDRQEIMSQIEELLKKAEIQQDEGRAEAAEELLNRARELRASLSRESDQPEGQRRRFAQAREMAMQVEQLAKQAEELAAAGRTEDAEEITKQIQELRQRLAQQTPQRAQAERRERAERTERGERERGEMDGIINGLEQGIEALLAIDRREEADHLRRLAIELSEQRQRDGRRAERLPREGGGEARDREGRDRQRAAAEERLEVLRAAHTAMREAEKPDAADMIEQMIAAAEMRLSGRDPEGVREPNLEQQIKLLATAAEIWEEFGHESKAAAVANLAEQMQDRFQRGPDQRDRPQRDRPRDGERQRDSERQREFLEIMRSAVPALKEANRQDTLELLERAMHARRMDLEGRRDEEANEIREQAPDMGQQVEILRYAADLWKEFGDEEKAGTLDELAGHLSELMRDRQGDRERPDRQNAERHIEELEKRISELSHHLQEIERQLQQLRSGDRIR